MSCEGECAMLVSTITTFAVVIGLTICMGCGLVAYCLRREATIVPNPLRGAIDEDPGPVAAAVAVSIGPSNRTQPEPEPTED